MESKAKIQLLTLPKKQKVVVRTEIYHSMLHSSGVCNSFIFTMVPTSIESLLKKRVIQLYWEDGRSRVCCESCVRINKSLLTSAHRKSIDNIQADNEYTAV